MMTESPTLDTPPIPIHEARRWRSRIALLLVCVMGIALIWGLLFWSIQSAQPVRIVAQDNDASVDFSAQRDTLAFAGDCVLVSWRAENIQRIFLNGQGVVGVATQEVCPSTFNLPTLRVIFNDDTDATYTLKITILSDQPPVLFAVAISALLLITVVYLLLTLLFGDGDGDAFWQSRWVRGTLRIAVVGMLGLGVLWWALDLGLRAYFSANGSEQQKIMYVYSVEEIRALQSNLIHVPYVSYLPAPDFEGHNTLGYRGEDIALPKPEGTFRIVALGGSTTYSTGTTADDAYPALLQKTLREEYDYTHVEVINAGFLGYTSWEFLATFAFRVLELNPDMIIIYAAVNDVAVREQSQTNCYAGDNPMRGLNPARGLFVERTSPYPTSTLYRFLAVNLGWIPNPLALDSAFEPARIDCDADAPDTTLEQRLERNPPIYFERNMRNLIALARANDVQPIISTWAYNTLANRPPLWRDTIAQHNTIMSALADDYDVPLYDLASAMPEDNALWEADGIHMITAGTTEQARQYARFLVENDLIPSTKGES